MLGKTYACDLVRNNQLFFHCHNFILIIDIINMTKEEKIKKIELLKDKANQLKREVDYFNALQLA